MSLPTYSTPSSQSSVTIPSQSCQHTNTPTLQILHSISSRHDTPPNTAPLHHIALVHLVYTGTTMGYSERKLPKEWTEEMDSFICDCDARDVDPKVAMRALKERFPVLKTGAV